MVLLFASCGNKGGNSGLMVPKDAAVVVHINSPSLSSKLSWDEIRQTRWFKEISKENTDTMAQQLLADPGSSGVDIKANMIFYIKKYGRNSYLIFAGSLTDAGAFEKFSKKMNEDAVVKKDGDFNYINSAKGGSVVWNKSHFAYAADAFVPKVADIIGRKNRSNSSGEFKSGFGSDSLKIFGIEALSLKKSNNLDNDDRFASLVKDGGDMHLWLNLGQYNSGMGSMMPMMETNALFEGNVSAISLNFENGRISAKSKHFFGDKMSKLLASHKAEPVSAAVINRIPSSNVVGVLAFNYSPGVIKDLLKLVGISELADMFLSRVNFSIDEFVRANKGEVLLSFSDLTATTKKEAMNTKSKVDTSNKRKMDMKILFATSVNDKAAFEKMVTIIHDLTKKLREGEIMKMKMPEINYKLDNNWFAASNSAEFRDKFLAGGDSKLPFVDKITGHPVGIYIDLQKLMGSLHSDFGDAATNNKKGSDSAVNIWQDIVVRGGEYKDKAIQFDLEVNLLDKNTNSLKQLNQYFDNHLSLVKKERMGKLKIKEITIEDIKDTVPKNKKNN
jgi:hypothetical protein